MLPKTKKLINKIIISLKAKKLFIKITYSNQHIQCIKQLLTKNLINGFEKLDNMIIIFLKYNFNNISAINSWSSTNKNVKTKKNKKNYTIVFKNINLR